MAYNNYGSSRSRQDDAYTAEYYAQYDSTISSGETRIPICFCIDVSSSMSFITNKREDYEYTSDAYSEDGSSRVRNVRLKEGVVAHRHIDDVRNVLKRMIHQMRTIPVLRNSAIISIITFSQFADCIVEFSEISRISDRLIDDIRTDAQETNSSKGIQMSLERLDSVSRIIRDAGNESYKPVLVFMSDGVPTDGEEADRARNIIRERSERGELNVIPIAIGGGGHDKWLRMMSRESRVYHMDSEQEFYAVFDKIATRINKTAAVISVDEGLIDDADLDDQPGADDTASSKYGVTSDMDDMMDFMSAFGQI